jgi:hypothetical protein
MAASTTTISPSTNLLQSRFHVARCRTSSEQVAESKTKDSLKNEDSRDLGVQPKHLSIAYSRLDRNQRGFGSNDNSLES